MSADSAVLTILLAGMLGKLAAMLMNARDARKREQDAKRLEAVMPPASSSFYPWNRQGRAHSASPSKNRRVNANLNEGPSGSLKNHPRGSRAEVGSFSAPWAAASDKEKASKTIACE